MNPAVKFIIRAVAGLVMAYFLARVFWRFTDWPWVLLFGAVLVGLSYLAESMRRSRD